MMLNAERTAVEWFEEAERWYVEGHQGCACCGRQHCVFRSEWNQRVEYYCSVCDFSACHDAATGRCFAVVGEGLRRPDVEADSAVLCGLKSTK